MGTATPEWTLGDRLRKAREFAGFTQTEMANYLGMARNTVANYENDLREPSAHTVAEWSTITDVSVAWLMEPSSVTARYSADPKALGPYRRRPSFMDFLPQTVELFAS